MHWDLESKCTQWRPQIIRGPSVTAVSGVGLGRVWRAESKCLARAPAVSPSLATQGRAMSQGSGRVVLDARSPLPPMDISYVMCKDKVDIAGNDAMCGIVRTIMEHNKIFKIVGAVVVGLLGYVIFGFFAGIAGAVIGVFLGPVAIKKFLNAR